MQVQLFISLDIEFLLDNDIYLEEFQIRTTVFVPLSGSSCASYQKLILMKCFRKINTNKYWF